MTPTAPQGLVDLSELRAKAEACLKAKGDNARWEALDALEAAANPATVLALLDRITALEEQARADGEALRRADEALAQFTAFEDDCRYIMGNTNFEIVKHCRDLTRARLSARGE